MTKNEQKLSFQRIFQEADINRFRVAKENRSSGTAETWFSNFPMGVISTLYLRRQPYSFISREIEKHRIVSAAYLTQWRKYWKGQYTIYYWHIPRKLEICRTCHMEYRKRWSTVNTISRMVNTARDATEGERWKLCPMVLFDCNCHTGLQLWTLKIILP